MANPDKPSRGQRSGDGAEAHPGAPRSRREIIDEIQRLARSISPRELDEPRVEQRHHRLYAAAVEVFGRWDVALASALREALGGGVSRVRRPPTPLATGAVRPPTAGTVPAAATREARPSPVMRQPHPGAMRPVIALTSRGHIVRVEGQALAASEIAAAPVELRGWVEALGAPTRLLDVGATGAVVALASDGRLFEWRSQEIPDVSSLDPAQAPGAVHGVERWLTLVPRDAVQRPGLLVHATASGKVKVSTLASLQEAMRADDDDARRAFSVTDPDDVAIGAWITERSDALLLASSSGHLIQLELDALRPAAPSGGGVRAMQLKQDARVVGGAIGSRGLELALITRRGWARRLPIDTLRTQARGGVGQACERLEAGDQLAAIVTCHPSTDLAVLTDRGRALRVPAPLLPLTERQGRGAVVVELDDDESVIGLSRLLPLAYTSSAPNAFEI